MAASSAPAASSQAASSAPSLPAYDADPLTGQAKSGNGRIIAVMVNNICNSARQNARPQRGLSSASIVIESRVEGSISRLCGEVFGSALTFGAAGQTSAPGQMDVKDLAEGLALIHRGL